MSDRSRTVIVGVDGTLASVAALEYAVRDARARGLSVEVVTAWSWPDPFRVEGALMLSRAARRRALRAQSAVMARVSSQVPDLPPCTSAIVEGDAAEVLSRAAHGAACLVLGHAMLGAVADDTDHTRDSVRERCLREATCPVVVVPAPPTLPREWVEELVAAAPWLREPDARPSVPGPRTPTTVGRRAARPARPTTRPRSPVP